jgi:hypothetical protein
MQDDLAIIGRWLPRVPQQFGSNISTAMQLTAAAASPEAVTAVSASGLLSTTGQADFFSFAAAAGAANVTVAVTPPFGVGQYNRANLNAAAAVYDESGSVLATFNPLGADNLGISAATLTIPSSGVYYVSVTGSGEGSPASDGYSNYASLGRYTLSVTYQSGYTPPAVNCAGLWGSWSVCNASCSQTMTYRITRPAANGGGACPVADGSVRTQPCSGGACVPAIDDPVMVIADINITRDIFNVSSNGTKITARADSGGAAVQYLLCKAVVTLQTKAGARLAKARISGAWLDSDAARLNPPAATATSIQTRSSGQAVFRSRPWKAGPQLPQQPAQLAPVSACVFTVSSVEFAGKTLDRGSSVMTQTLRWN